MLPDLNLHEAIEGVRSLLKDLTNIMGLFDKNVQAWVKVTKRINNKREVQKIARVHHLMTRLIHEQRSVPETLKAYADKIDERMSKQDRSWLLYEESHLQQAISSILEWILQLREF